VDTAESSNNPGWQLTFPLLEEYCRSMASNANIDILDRVNAKERA
jgi:hypothetical protein